MLILRWPSRLGCIDLFFLVYQIASGYNLDVSCLLCGWCWRSCIWFLVSSVVHLEPASQNCGPHITCVRCERPDVTHHTPCFIVRGSKIIPWMNASVRVGKRLYWFGAILCKRSTYTVSTPNLQWTMPSARLSDTDAGGGSFRATQNLRIAQVVQCWNCSLSQWAVVCNSNNSIFLYL